MGKWEVVCLFWGGGLRVEGRKGGRVAGWKSSREAGWKDGRVGND